MRVRTAGVREALGAAVLFGAATPFASRLVSGSAPQMVAGLLYLGSGLVLGASLVAWPTHRQAPLSRAELPALAGAVFFGGGLGPLLLLIGLRSTPAATASLLLNLEVVFTALVAWLVLHEGVDRRLALGFACIVVGAGTVAWDPSGSVGVPLGALAIVGACLCWAVDNNLTQQISSKDPRQIAAIKGLVAGGANVTIALVAGAALPAPARTAAAMGVGVIGYGISLMLFVFALRSLGAARTGAYFAVAPFVGVLVAVVVLGDPMATRVWPAGGLIAVGVWLHLSERHDHRHRHEPLAHTHPHTHDDLHHGHHHEAVGGDPRTPHVHEHVHDPTEHSHPHRPDIHHRHA